MTKANKIDKLYNAIAYAETGGESNRWIRTKIVSGSTAYGPVQLTITKARDYFNRFKLGEFALFMAKFESQASLFLRHGNTNPPNEYKMFDYGGSGNLDEQAKRDYVRFAKTIMAIDYNHCNGDIDCFIRKWRGVNENEDPHYYAKTKDKLT